MIQFPEAIALKNWRYFQVLLVFCKLLSLLTLKQSAAAQNSLLIMTPWGMELAGPSTSLSEIYLLCFFLGSGERPIESRSAPNIPVAQAESPCEA